MEVRGVWRGGFETRLEDGRGHGVIVDLPTDEGGRNLGTSPLELAVISLAGCIGTIFGLIAEKRKLSFDGLTVSLKAERPESAPTIEKVHGTVEVQTSAPREAVETVLRLTLKTCPVGILFERAHVPLEVSATIVPPSPSKEGSSPEYEIPEPEWAL